MLEVPFWLCIYDPAAHFSGKLLRLNFTCPSNRFSTATKPRILDFPVIEKDISSPGKAGWRTQRVLNKRHQRLTVGNVHRFEDDNLYNWKGIADRPMGKIEFSISKLKAQPPWQRQQQSGVVHDA
jgi:hypothetical protein